MVRKIRLWVEVATQAMERPWVRRAFILWAIIGTWDTAISELLPPNLSERAPRVYGVLEMTSGWIPFWGWLLAGAAILVAAVLELAVRYVGEQNLLARYTVAVADIEKGRLDYLVGGLQATHDVTKAVNSSARDTQIFAKAISRYSTKLHAASSPIRQHRIAAKAAARMNAYASRIQRVSDLVEAATPTISESQFHILENTPIMSLDDKKALSDYITAIEGTAYSAIDATSNLKGMQEATFAVRGISAALNAAAANLHDVIGDLIQNTEQYAEKHSQIVSIARSKLEAAGAPELQFSDQP